MGIDFNAFWFDRRPELYGTYSYFEPGWPLYLPESILLTRRPYVSDTNGIHRLEWTPIVIPPPVITNDAYFLEHRFYKSDDDIHRLEWIPIVLPIPVFYEGVRIYHWVEPVRSTAGDDAYFLIRNLPPLILDFGASSHVTFTCKRLHFYNNSTGDEFLWNFGDGATSTSRSPAHTYHKAGVYQVTLKIDGVVYTDPKQVVVFENSFILDSGAVYINYGESNAMKLGATEGGNQFGIETDFRYMTFDGESGQLEGAHRVLGSTPKIIANFVAINYRLLNIALPGSSITFESGSVEITRALKKLFESDYIKNIAIVAEHGGTGCFIIFKIFNAISVENLEIPFEDGKESVIEITFAGNFHPDNLVDEPWEIDFVIS